MYSPGPFLALISDHMDRYKEKIALHSMRYGRSSTLKDLMVENRITVKELIAKLEKALAEHPDLKYIEIRCDGCLGKMRLWHNEDGVAIADIT